MDVHEKLIRIRKYRNLTQLECAGWFRLSASSYGRKERGKEGGLGPGQIQLFLDNTQIDARWLFGQLDGPIEEADLRLRGPEKSLTQQMIEEIKELRKHTRPLKELDPLAERVISDLELRRLVEKMIRKRAHFKRIEGYLDGLEEGVAETREFEKVKKEKAG